jgi:outer membrane protein
MNTFYSALFASFLLFLSVEMPAQTPSGAPRLSIEEAVQLALANNYDVRLARADADIAHLNNTRGNAGLLPTVNLVANENLTLSAFQQRLANGNEFNAIGAPFNNFNAGVQLSQTLFDGRRMFIERDRLIGMDTLAQLQLRQQMQQLAAAVTLAYGEIARFQNLEQSIRQIIVLNEERLRIAEARLAAGFAAETDALAARLDLNQRQSDLLQQQNTTRLAKYNFNLLLARDANTDFSVDDSQLSKEVPDRATLIERLGAHNATLLTLKQSAAMAQLNTDLTRKLASPRLTGIGQFNALRTDNGAGFLKNNTQAGLAVGLAFTMPLYDGGNIKRQTAVAKVQAEQAELRVAAQTQQLTNELDQLLATAATQQQVLALEQKNVALARQNLLVSTERFRLGQTNGLEVQIAQNTLEQSLFRENQAYFNVHNIVTRLRLIGGLL